MIYFIILENEKNEVENLLQSIDFKKYKEYWAYENISLIDNSSIIDKKTGKTSWRLETSSSPRYASELKERGFRAGETTRTDLSSLESLLIELKSDNILKSRDIISKRVKDNIK